MSHSARPSAPTHPHTSPKRLSQFHEQNAKQPQMPTFRALSFYAGYCEGSRPVGRAKVSFPKLCNGCGRGREALATV
ncbi:hypothetical protein CORC01_09216 [Colletotrichum orchidophilum]|uniref:Uncharacterized protein n=1 Tax=Colletotrichum orchidophilum TaxID=1209926 RepID=A0A1G4B2B0_9PEZI|nr:uncharacterized protein CORC01_09216 [Colletotrichum orchidophilum]OHE95483.1 hypothetical protein CORC01_09216 [Colletotrichum orchidophilum]